MDHSLLDYLDYYARCPRELPDGGIPLTPFQLDCLLVVPGRSTPVATTPGFTFGSGFLIRGRFDVAALRSSVEWLLHTNDALRSYVDFESQFPCQRIAERVPVDQALTEVPGEPDDVAKTSELVSRAVTTISPDRSPSVRVAVGRVADEVTCLWVAMHHLWCDGAAFGRLLSELWRAYAAFAAGGVPSRDSVPGPTYLEYANSFVQGAGADFAYWDQLLETVFASHGGPTSLPARSPGSGNGGTRTYQRSWPAPTSKLVLDIARAHRVLPLAVLLPVVGLGLRDFVDTDTPLIPTVLVSGPIRDPALRSLIACTTATGMMIYPSEWPAVITSWNTDSDWGRVESLYPTFHRALLALLRHAGVPMGIAVCKAVVSCLEKGLPLNVERTIAINYWYSDSARYDEASLHNPLARGEATTTTALGLPFTLEPLGETSREGWDLPETEIRLILSPETLSLQLTYDSGHYGSEMFADLGDSIGDAISRIA